MADMELVKASKNLENATAQLRDFNQSTEIGRAHV